MIVPVLIACAFLLAACGSGGGTLVPPRADVSGIQVVAVFPFGNETPHGGLGETFMDHLMTGLQAVGWYEIVPTEQVIDLMTERRMSSGGRIDDDVWVDMARDIAAELEADGIIIGNVIDYSDEVTVGAPYRVDGGTSAEWRVDQTTRATVTVEAKLVNVHTGDAVHEQRAVGTGRIDEPRLLNWSSPSEPPATIVPTPHRRDVTRAREMAVQQAFAAFARDILPHREATHRAQHPSEDGDLAHAEN